MWGKGAIKAIKTGIILLMEQLTAHYEKKPTKNIRPTDILQIFSKCSQNY